MRAPWAMGATGRQGDGVSTETELGVGNHMHSGGAENKKGVAVSAGRSTSAPRRAGTVRVAGYPDPEQGRVTCRGHDLQHIEHKHVMICCSHP